MFKKFQRLDCIQSLLQGKVIVQVSNKAFKKSEKLNMIKDYIFVSFELSENEAKQ